MVEPSAPKFALSHVKVVLRRPINDFVQRCCLREHIRYISEIYQKCPCNDFFAFPPPSFAAAHWQLLATSGPDWATIEQDQNRLRKKRTRSRAARLAATSCLPSRMARHEAMKAVDDERASYRGGDSTRASGRKPEEISTVVMESSLASPSGEGGMGVCGTALDYQERMRRVMRKQQKR